MGNLDVRHFLGIYTTRKEMQEAGITNPSEEIKTFTRELVKKLKAYPLDEKVLLQDGSFFNSKGNLIMRFPECNSK